MKSLSFFVSGTAAPQGSSRAFVIKRTGRAIVTTDNKKLKPWRQEVWGMAVVAAQEADWTTTTEPVSVRLQFGFLRPDGHFGARGLRASAPALKTTKPDIDKLGRAILDALGDAAIFRDDAQVVELILTKHYADREPGVEIRVALVTALLGGTE